MDEYLTSNGINLGGLDYSPMGFNKAGEVSTNVEHFTAVDVNEDGVDATAVTVTTSYMMNPREKAVFEATRPFAYFIIENKTKTILLAGLLEDPTK